MFTFGKGMPKLLATVIVATGLLHPAIAASTSQAEKVSLPAVDALAAKPLAGVSDVRLQPIFKSGLMEAQRLSTATADGTIYVATGDIPAEWLRDSSAQVRPYLYLAVKDEGVRDYLRRVIARHGKCMQLDPYANAFRADYTVWERKYELDSLLYPIILAWTYWKATGDASIFTADYQQGLLSALATMELEQHHQAKSKFTHETLGKNPVAETGMIWTAFRPSDDPSKYNYLIPSEMMAVVALGELAEIEKDVYKDATAASKAEAMKLAVHNGIQHYAIVHTSRFGDVYAFEVDGLGNSLLMDDANIPSLLGAPYMGYLSANDPIYQNTRRMLLSPDDPNFHTGTVASGIGSEHTPAGTIWPLSMLMQAFTATTDNERDECVRQLLASDPGDHTLHESFYPDDPKRYTRPDFGWPNALFAEYVMLHTLHMPPLPVPPQSDLPAREALQKPNQK